MKNGFSVAFPVWLTPRDNLKNRYSLCKNTKHFDNNKLLINNFQFSTLNSQLFNMDIQEFAKIFPERMKKLKDFAAGDDIKDILGTEAVNHYKESFDNQGFTDKTTNPWQDVKRRDSSSPWYGHSGQTGKFSNARTTAPVLNGETLELKNATTYAKTERGVRVSNDKPYARVHNYGGRAKIYGKKEFQMPERKFIGRSAVMVAKINAKIKREFQRIIKGG